MTTLVFLLEQPEDAALRATDEGLLRERKQMHKKAADVRDESRLLQERFQPGNSRRKAQERLVRVLHQENSAHRPGESQRHRRDAACDRLPKPVDRRHVDDVVALRLAGQGVADRRP